MAKQRARRAEPPLPAAAVVIRGDLLDPEVLAESAGRNFDVYGFYGMSVFAETADLAWTDLAATRLVAVPWLVLSGVLAHDQHPCSGLVRSLKNTPSNQDEAALPSVTHGWKRHEAIGHGSGTCVAPVAVQEF
jgi:hypothetical protein